MMAQRMRVATLEIMETRGVGRMRLVCLRYKCAYTNVLYLLITMHSVYLNYYNLFYHNVLWFIYKQRKKHIKYTVQITHYVFNVDTNEYMDT